jgi:hypothetical protein
MQPAPSLPPLQAQQLQQSQHGLPKLRATAGESAFASTLDGQSKLAMCIKVSQFTKVGHRGKVGSGTDERP